MRRHVTEMPKPFDEVAERLSRRFGEIAHGEKILERPEDST
jgi:hypothetical protein